MHTLMRRSATSPLSPNFVEQCVQIRIDDQRTPKREPRTGKADSSSTWWLQSETDTSWDMYPQVELHRAARHHQRRRHLERGHRQRHTGQAALPQLARRIELGEVGMNLLDAYHVSK